VCDEVTMNIVYDMVNYLTYVHSFSFSFTIHNKLMNKCLNGSIISRFNIMTIM